ncbi:hypothetical protein [Mammaliicoccus sciuri]|uniref:hypothetical protein n=1 Tax=Mammaliicoccus sciuri TaxID=1296 RepID=UPI001FB325EA|nr:hypothetical protein [Mammaliicoccus sciuri]MCJ0965536.1 hypothetical protein [Mammaliicoccus sciuri]
MSIRLKIKIIKVTTPIQVYKESKETRIEDYFDFNRFNYCIKEIMSKDKLDRKKTYKDTETYFIDSYDENYSDEFAVGNFITTTHGYYSNSIDVEDLRITNELSENEGIENKVLFIIDKKSGYLYIQNDKFNVINISRLRSYFFVKKKERMKFINKYFEINKPSYIDENYNKLYHMELLDPLPFLEKIEDLKTVRSIKVNPVTSKNNINTKYKKDLLSRMKKDADEYNIGQYETEIIMNRFNQKDLTHNLKEFIKYIAKDSKYGDVSVEGLTKDDVPRKITEDTHTRDFYIDIELDTNGYPVSQVFNENIIKYINSDKQLNVINSIYDGVKEIDLDSIN